MPIATHKGTYQQQQSGFGLVEIGNQLVHYMELITRLNHNLRLSMQYILPRSIKIIHQCLQRLPRTQSIFSGIWCKLRYG